ncbi:hypothetical protein ACKVWC_005026 [Pyricularia oryzae]
MDHPNKRRRLAPKLPDPPQQPSPPVPGPATSPAQHATTYANDQPLHHGQQYQGQEPAPIPERHDFESFARHLQDAAMLIYRQTQRSPYTSVSVLLLRWEEDKSVEKDLVELEAVLRDRYNYQTDKWTIPSVHNPSIKLSVQMASYMENARPDHLLVIYYAGHGYVGMDNHLYWACHKGDDSAKLKWDGLRCLLEDAQSDMLLLLDTCAPREAPMAGSHGFKQAIAAYTPDRVPRESPCRSFTSYLTESLARLSVGRAFTLQRLYDEIISLQPKAASERPQTNGSGKLPTFHELRPVVFTLAAGQNQSMVLPILPAPDGKSAQSDQPRADAGVLIKPEEQLIGPEDAVDLIFDEARALVCTTFVGDASQDMTFFNNWLQNAPPIASKIKVEGMFLGPPTMLLVSMPLTVWNVVQHDKVCCFLGHITSHNMTHLYDRLVGSSVGLPTPAKDVDDGRILWEATKAAANLPNLIRHEEAAQGMPPPAAKQLSPETPARPRGGPRHELPSSAPSSAHSKQTNSVAAKEVEDSVEMQEAAEQLKALSHMPASGEGKSSASAVSQSDLKEENSTSSHDESGGDETLLSVDGNATSTKPKQARSLQKQPLPRLDTRCNMCTHAPFKDSSSLRKHIAAAHTRPFPCAFSFAGCTSTFGSKNEWKRHISSQHLCLQYYRCSSCPLSAIEGKGNEFNRKDLFTQHLRRMHAPFAIKKSIKSDGKLQTEWDSHVKEMQQTCLVTRRKPPQKSACPKAGCQTIFEGPTSWDEWTEHVGRHMEKGDGQSIGVDGFLAKWALEEGIIERKEDGEYRLCNQDELPGKKDGSVQVTSASQPSKSPKDESPRLEDEGSIVVAMPNDDGMDVDD